jgi:hypothetical protein
MANTYTLIEQITVGAATASSVTFNSIPETGYTDLKVVCSVRSTRVNPSDGMNLEFNADTANSYSTRRIYGVGSGTPTSDLLTPYARIFLNDIPGSTATASTFCNSEFYVPNYSSSNQKSVSADTAFENNTTAAGLVLLAGLWTGTAAISSIRLYPDGGNFAEHSTFSLYGVSALGTTPTKAPQATGGSIIQTDETYWYHAFLSSGTFTPATALTCDVLVIAGGGGPGYVGSNNAAGGGGAGQINYATAQTFTSNTAYTTTIGGGGTRTVSTSAAGGQGSTSSVAGSGLTTISATGGGGGGSVTASATQGGSGGGGSTHLTTGASANGTNTNAGSDGFSSTNASGGSGGGAGGTGTVATNTTASNGGAGLNTWSAWLNTTGTGVSGYIAGGGAGGYYSTNGSYTVPTGGSGGGGNGGYYYGGTIAGGVAGVANTGSGGGAYGLGVGGENGGSGLVIIRYLA